MTENLVSNDYQRTSYEITFRDGSTETISGFYPTVIGNSYCFYDSTPEANGVYRSARLLAAYPMDFVKKLREVY